MLQTAYEIAGDDRCILRRLDDSADIGRRSLFTLLDSAEQWLIVIDESDRAAHELFATLRDFPHELRGRCNFLLASRDSDWIASGAGRLAWSTVCAFHPLRWEGLKRPDAEAIVGAWAAYGSRGLGDIAEVDEKDRAETLLRYAQQEQRTRRERSLEPS
jgi:hypothetical protein